MGFAQGNRELQGLSVKVTSSKSSERNTKKTQENFILNQFWAFFVHFRPNKQENVLPSPFCTSRFLSMCKISGENNEQISRKIGSRRTGRHTDKNDFIGPLQPGVQSSIILIHSCAAKSQERLSRGFQKHEIVPFLSQIIAVIKSGPSQNISGNCIDYVITFRLVCSTKETENPFDLNYFLELQ